MRLKQRLRDKLPGCVAALEEHHKADSAYTELDKKLWGLRRPHVRGHDADGAA